MEMDPLKMYFLLNMGDLPSSYVSLPGRVHGDFYWTYFVPMQGLISLIKNHVQKNQGIPSKIDGGWTKIF